jgi:hypothetical protein
VVERRQKEETGVEAAAEETGLNGVDSDDGDRRSTERRSRERRGLREFWDENQMTRGQATIYGFADSFIIRIEAVLV